jgi:hypothetical protein
VSKIFFYEPRRREGREGREEKRKSSQFRGGLLWQYDFIYEEDFFTAEDAEDTEKESFDIKSSAFICVYLRLKTPINYAPNFSPNSSFA